MKFKQVEFNAVKKTRKNWFRPETTLIDYNNYIGGLNNQILSKLTEKGLSYQKQREAQNNENPWWLTPTKITKNNENEFYPRGRGEAK